MKARPHRPVHGPKIASGNRPVERRPPERKTGLIFDLTWSVAAFFFWGGWACWINMAAGTGAGIVAGLVQGGFSFVMTLIMVRAVSRIYNRLYRHRLRYLLPAVITVGCSGTLLAAIHLLAGTPHIPATIAPPMTIAFFFCLYTARHLELRNQ